MGGRHSTRRRPSQTEPEDGLASGAVEPRPIRSVERLREQQALQSLQQLERLIHAFLRRNDYQVDRTALSYALPPKAPTLTEKRATAALKALLHIDRARHAVFDRQTASAAQDSLLAMAFTHDAIGGSALERWRQRAGGLKKAERFAEIKKEACRLATRLRESEQLDSTAQIVEVIHDRFKIKYDPCPAERTLRGWLSEQEHP